MATSNTRSGFSGQGRPNRGHRRADERGSRDRQPTLDTSGIRFGTQISPKLYSDVAEDAAKAVAPKRDERGRTPDVNKGTQLRRFYDELVMLQGKVGSSDERFSTQAPFVQMLKAKVAYARGRQKVDLNFDHLLRHVIDQIKDPATFAQAKLFMEAFMAFYKVYDDPKD